MRRLGLVAALLLILARPAAAEGDRRMMNDAEAMGARAVGRLNIAGNRFCTATLISDRLVLTAAHCLFHPVNKRQMPAGSFSFVAGQRHNGEAAVRRVRRVARLSDFIFDPPANLRGVGADVALLELSEPIGPDLAVPFSVAEAGPRSSLSIISYARDRPYEPSIQGPCPVVTFAPRIGILNCQVNFGASGAPVLSGPAGDRQVVAVVSAIGQENGGGTVALVVPVAPRLATLLARLDHEESASPTP